MHSCEWRDQRYKSRFYFNLNNNWNQSLLKQVICFLSQQFGIIDITSQYFKSMKNWWWDCIEAFLNSFGGHKSFCVPNDALVLDFYLTSALIFKAVVDFFACLFSCLHTVDSSDSPQVYKCWLFSVIFNLHTCRHKHKHWSCSNPRSRMLQHS